MKTQERSSVGGAASGRAAQASKQRAIKIAGLSIVIVAALLFTFANPFGGSSPAPTAGTKGRPIDSAQISLAQAVMTEQNKWKFAGVNIRASEDGTKLIVSGKVGSEADLSELQKSVDAAKGATAVEYAVTVSPATGPKVEIPGLGK